MQEILRKLVAFQTIAGNQTAIHQLLDYVANFVTARGMHVEWYESNGFESIVATVKPGDKTPKVLLAAHIDVVPATSDDDFNLVLRDDRFYGRGVLDMKFAVASYLQVIDDIKDSLDQYDIGLMLTSDEELGGQNGVAKLVDEGYIPEVCILPDGGDNWQIQTSSKGFWAFEISVEGRAAHGSRHWQGDNAIAKLLATLDTIKSLFPDNQDQTGDTNTISLNLLNGGVAINQVPELASMTIDVRTVNSTEHRRLYQAITDICHRDGARYQYVSDGSPTKFELTDPLIAPFAAFVTQHTGVEQHGYHALGASDVRYYVPFGIPCISVYPHGGDLHADGEWIETQALEQFRAILRDYLEQVACLAP